MVDSWATSSLSWAWINWCLWLVRRIWQAKKNYRILYLDVNSSRLNVSMNLLNKTKQKPLGFWIAFYTRDKTTGNNSPRYFCSSIGWQPPRATHGCGSKLYAVSQKKTLLRMHTLQTSPCICGIHNQQRHRVSCKIFENNLLLLF